MTKGPTDLATPIAKSAARVSRSAAGRERFDASLLAFEVFVKYSCCVTLAGFNQFDRDRCYSIEYQLSRDIALGSWVRRLAEAISAIRNPQYTKIPDWLFDGMNWLNRKRKVNRDPWLKAVHPLASNIHGRLKEGGDRSEYPLSTVMHLLNFLTHVRNKTRGHGAKPDSFYRSVEPDLTTVVQLLALECPWSHLRLLVRVPGTFRDSLVLRGASPAERITMEGHVPGHPDRSILVSPTGEIPAYLPPLIEYQIDHDRCFFANDAFRDSIRQMEFMDYFSGEVEHLSVPNYAIAPVHQDRIRDVCEFPKAELSSTMLTLIQAHRPEVIGQVRSRLTTATWTPIPLTDANRGRPPSAGGVYCLVSHAEAVGLTAHRVVGYVGRTSNICNRFENYLDEKDAERGRRTVRSFLVEFPEIFFWYTIVDSPESQRRLEEWMVRAIDPPVNETLRLKGASGPMKESE